MDNMKQYNSKNLYDVIIIGGGPAGLTAAIYLARAQYRVLIIEKEQFGGQITITHEIINYPGIGKTSGKELTDTMHHQAEYFGTEFMLAEAIRLNTDDDVKTVHTSRGDFHCFGILIATGAHPQKIGFIGEDEYKGRGVAYCATCDGEFFTGKNIFVAGGGYAAAEESVFLTKFARHVTIIIRDEDFSCAATVAEGAKNNKKITIITNSEIEEVSGENSINYIRCRNNKTNEITEYRADSNDFFGVFVFAGYSPNTTIVKNIIALDEHGYILTDSCQKTNIKGIFAAGDVCIKPLRQVVTATGDGAVAATELEKYAAVLQSKTGLHPKIPDSKKTKNQKTFPSPNHSDEFFTKDIRQQLNDIFDKMEQKLILKLFLDNRTISSELENFMKRLTALSEKLSLKIAEKDDTTNNKPCVRIYRENGEDSGISFHGVPSGHEFTSFILGLYNVSGPGQKIDTDIIHKIKQIKTPINIKIFVSLSCTMCPELVIACQRIASLNPNISADVYDIQHFETLKSNYNIMSVPCMIINNDHVFFGKKNINQIMELLTKVC